MAKEKKASMKPALGDMPGKTPSPEPLRTGTAPAARTKN